ncbi:DEAD/DEAH box helicase [Zestomonas thermotolerans]|uniref:DEAD/DEAH box helicase n=1 Tax=Zestomonas thermotolerans TaxID=157784 RepID=UPI0004818842|nr:DEAD/DEAH box helicase [Pseudomonas thermotolerans]
MTFAALGMIEPLLRALAGLGYQTPTAIQQQAIPAVLAGRDLLATAQTGTGKTAGFALPLLQLLVRQGPRMAANSVRALVLVPTRELAEQVHASLRRYGRFLPLRSAVAYGGVSINPQMLQLRQGVDVLVATPGRLLDLHRQNALHFRQLQVLVLDEADRMLDLGFAAELRELLALLPKRRQTLLFSATFAAPLRELAGQLLEEPLRIEIGPRNVTAASVSQWLIAVDKRRKAELFLHLLKERRWGQVLVFARTRKGVDQLCAQLEAAGVSAAGIHGDRPQPARLRALERFRAGAVQVLVATDVAARGLDIDDLPLVVNLDLPNQAEDYVHRIGRTGRAGARGQALSLVCADEVARLTAIETLIRQSLRREEEPGFEAEHRVPASGPGSRLAAQVQKPACPAKSGAPKEAAPSRPLVRAVRPMPGFASGLGRNPRA